MSDLSELYQQVVLDHGKRPRNFRPIEHADCSADGYNPLCGDRVTVYVRLRDESLEDVSFTGSGCAICTASASLMTQHMKGRSSNEAQAIFQCMRGMLTGESAPTMDIGKLAVLGGVKQYPMRVKCATLPWHTLHAALEKRDATPPAEPVSTE